jgi:hypothetical protein
MPQFETCLKECLPGLWRYAFSLTRNRALADDLAQDCAERAFCNSRSPRMRFMRPMPAAPLNRARRTGRGVAGAVAVEPGGDHPVCGAQ